MKKRILSLLILAVLIGALALTAGAVDTSREATLYYRGIQITLDGQKLNPTDANGVSVEPFIIDGTTYLPVRAVANALGLGVDWDGNTSTVILTSPGAAQTGSAAGGEQYAACWEDSWSGRCGMEISHIRDEYYNIFIHWGNSAFDTAIWSLLGKYNPETGALDYIGIMYDAIFENPDSPTCEIYDDCCAGSFYFDAAGTLRWTDRSDCTFVKTGEAPEFSEYVQVNSPDGYAYLNESTRGDYALLTAIPNGVILPAMFVSENWAQVSFWGWEGYIPAYEVTDVNFDPAKPAPITAYWVQDWPFTYHNEFTADTSPDQTQIVLVADETVKDFKFLSLHIRMMNADGSPQYLVDPMYSQPEFVPEWPLLVNMTFYGDMPSYGISYVDQSGATRYFAIGMSGKDGSLLLLEF